MLFSDIYRQRRVLVTGHTGFKGSWLVLWLVQLGAHVKAIALPPEGVPNHWSLMGLQVDARYIDVRSADELREEVVAFRPEIIFHLAAQSLVRSSYRIPLETWATNVLGTASLLDACRCLAEPAAVVIVTSDKCYENHEWLWGYREIDALGGHDPYSASKAACELVVASYRNSYLAAADIRVASARAGNVIGGGDWSEDRLIPDLVRAVQTRKSLEIRSPGATRPWQHVLECLSGYLVLGEKLYKSSDYAEAWNFGPDREGNRTVAEVLDTIKGKWASVAWHLSRQAQPHEATFLHLDSSKARERLSWRPVWSLDEAVSATVEWYNAWSADSEIISVRQLREYVSAAMERGVSWARGSST